MHQNMLDTMHRGYLAYKEETSSDPSCRKLQRAVAASRGGKDTFDTVLSTCEVATDWIERIEASLPYVDRAVRENRQFILRTGETVPIEKVRRVSKTSVEHLARHSEYITREPEEGEDITPERLLMTENIGTYAVYENRFLYMLLLYVKDFCTIKYQKIAECANSFSSEIEYERKIESKKKNIEFSLRYKEISTEQIPTRLSEHTESCMVRIKNILADVDALLKTGLMIEVSTAPLLKPPIARTNVLISNPCFAAAVELYDYLCAYTGKGYEEKDLHRTSGTLTDEARSDLGELIALSSYLSYRHGGLDEELGERHRRMLEQKRAEEERLLDEHIEKLKTELGELSPSVLEYILSLEQWREMTKQKLEAYDSGQNSLAAAQKRLCEVEAELSTIRGERDALRDQVNRALELDRLKEQAHKNELERAALAVRQKDEEMKKTVERVTAQAEEYNARLKSEYEALSESYHLVCGRLRAHESSEGDFTSREDFARLEAEYKAFKRFFDGQWKKTKARIRAERLKKKTSPPQANGAERTEPAASGQTTDTNEANATNEANGTSGDGR